MLTLRSSMQVSTSRLYNIDRLYRSMANEPNVSPILMSEWSASQIQLPFQSHSDCSQCHCLHGKQLHVQSQGITASW